MSRETEYGTVTDKQVDVCQFCKYKGQCSREIIEYCVENLKNGEYFE